MKRILFISALLLASIFAFAQTQQGVVKTKGRLDANGNLIPGKGLKGATVSVHGRAAVLVNADDGAFSFPIPDKQFRLDSVRKKGYQLVDMDALSKTYKHSANPIYLVMETPEQQFQDRIDNFNKINAAQQALISQLRSEVKLLKEENKLTEEEYYQQLAEIANIQIENQDLVSDMAERYSKIDFDQLDEFNQQISQFIINGDLGRADSLINSKGKMDDRRSEYYRIRTANEKESLDLKVRKENLEKSKAYEQKKLEELGQDCYHKYETCKLRHQSDSAMYWLEYRFALDTLNEEWLDELNDFLFYLFDYQKALSYLQRSLQLAISNHGENSYKVATVYNDMGVAYFGEYDLENGLDCYDRALAIDSILNIQDESLYYNFSQAYHYSANYDKARQYLQMALEIAEKNQKEDNVIATIYDGIASLYHDQGMPNESVDYYNQSLNLFLKQYGYYHPKTATVYNNMGLAYKDLKEYSKAMDCFNNSITIIKELFGLQHPSLGIYYNNIGTVYFKDKNFKEAMQYYETSLSINENAYGAESMPVSYDLNNIGTACLIVGEHEKALHYLNEALKIREKHLGTEHPLVATTTHNIAGVYESKGELDKALELYNKALLVRIKLLGEEHPSTINTKNRISEIQSKQKEQESEK